MPPQGGLTEEQVGNVYVQVLHNMSLRALGTDAERQAMADAAREFYGLLTDAIRSRRYNNRVIPIASRSCLPPIISK
jgi:hypothetical protein